ncbi:LacI family DNA-binding transcriptional regulator [Catalinimonas alkaloidigena]|uniref:LacI family DNA-binding transcriptional regulator n=1 Tax=Catalinimonas alkaloidigena TaxID=1075417 RepID=UPI000B7C686E|nr:LacI family DNA-binding transcriptional regulator [Catalinimonas alkaloidigena]
MKTTTIKDIAQALGISTSTVSRALRDSYEINPETKRLVLDYAEKMHYRPNPIALSLKGSFSKAIGVVVPEIANHFFSQAINGIEELAYSRGYHVVIFQTHESHRREVDSINHLAAIKVDGLLVSLSHETRDVAHLQCWQERGLPIVLFDRVSDQLETLKVVADNYKGAYQATEHLILSGRKRIAVVSNSPSLSITDERLEGYYAALERYDLTADASLVRHCGFREEDIRRNVESLLHLSPRPDAIFTTSDRLALTTLATLQENRVAIPVEVALVGFTNLQVAHLLSPAMTTVMQPAFEMGRTGAELLLDVIAGKSVVKNEVQKLPTQLIPRASTAGKRCTPEAAASPEALRVP